MAETLPIPPFPAAEARPSRARLQQGIAVFRAELEAAADQSSQALLLHHLGRLFAREQDFAAAAREELAATNLAAGFAAPLEALWAIAVRGRSRKNAEVLLGRLHHIARTPAERERAGLALAALELEDGRTAEARDVLLALLQNLPSGHSGTLAAWILLEEVAHREADPLLARRALTGRASGAGSDEVESLLYERAARLALELGELDEADALLDQALVTFPRWSTLLRRERMLTRAGRPDRAALAALAALDHLQAHLDGATPGGAPLPPLARSAAVAQGLRLRAALSWAAAGDAERALEQVRLAAEAPSASLFEHALHLALSERVADQDGQARALARACESLRDSDRESVAAIDLWRWAKFERAGFDRTEADHSATDPSERGTPAGGLADSPGLLGILLEHAERTSDAAGLPGLLERIAALTARARASERTDLLLSATWLAFGTGQIDEGKRLLALARAEEASEELTAAVELGLARQSRHVAAELAALERLTGLVDDARTREFFAWLAFRRALVPTSGSADAEGFAADAATTRRLLGKLVEESPSSAPIRLAAWLWGHGIPGAQGDGESVFRSRELTRADTILRLLQDDRQTTSYERIEAALRASPDDPLLTALAARTAEDEGAPAADRIALLTRFAAQAESPALAQGARLRALLLLLKERLASGGPWPTQPHDQMAPLIAELAREPELAPLWLWLSRARGLPLSREGAATEDGDEGGGPLGSRPFGRSARQPERTEPWLELEGALRQLGNVGALHEAPVLELSDAPLSGAARLLQALVVIATGDVADVDLASQLPQTSDRIVGGLLLGAASHRAEASARLSAAKRFHELAPGADSRLAYAVAARLADDPNEETRAARALAEELGAPELVARAQLYVRPAELNQERVRQVLELAEGCPRHVRAAIAWDLCEHTGPSTGLRGQALELLGDSIPGELDGPLAHLLAGFQAIVAGDDDHALELLLPLTETLPDDAVVHLGLCAAAQRAGRADIEAASSAELARREADPAEAARLWERAGVLLQDQLGRPDQAEAAFQSAMGRVPGSPLSFVRLYQLAHAKQDRPRMVELIDARLEVPVTEEQRASLLWEKARHCRHLGRRSVASRALEELLERAPDHLPALALLAELSLLDQRPDRAAPLLRQIALHPSTPLAQRESAGLHAVDLLERLALPREAMDLLAHLEASNVPLSRTRRRKARLAARVGRWDVAASAFRQLAEEDDDIPTRLEAARMLLAIERDHLRESANLKDAARLVLRDAPTDADAAAIVVQENFHPDERTRLLAPVREATLARLRERPLDLPIINQMADFSEGTDNVQDERAWLGALALTGRLSDARAHRLEALTKSARSLPSGSLTAADLEAIAAPGQLGTMAELARIVVPKIAKATLPDLAALGVSESMRKDPFGEGGLVTEIVAFAEALGLPEPTVFVGGLQPGAVLLLSGELPQLVLGSGTTAPLTASLRVRIGYLLFAEALGVAPLLALGLDEAKSWLSAVARLTARALPEREPDEVEERARLLARLLGSDDRSELGRLAAELEKGDRQLTDLPLVTLTSAARAVTFFHGEPSILRQLRELIPDAEQERTPLLASVIQLLASPRTSALRAQLGLDLG